MIDTRELMRLNAQFWREPTLADLIADQSPRVIQSLDDFAAPWWPDDESADAFVAFVADSRAETEIPWVMLKTICTGARSDRLQACCVIKVGHFNKWMPRSKYFLHSVTAGHTTTMD